MKMFVAVVSFSLWSLLSVISASAGNYVDTSGNVIEKASFGEACRPTWKLRNGDTMIFGTSKTDVAMLETKLIESGMTDKKRMSG